MTLSWLEAAAIIDESFYGPLPDIISTQGDHLKPRPDTPVVQREHDPEFVTQLEKRLNRLLFRQGIRCDKYGKETAEEWPISHTPTEIVERWLAAEAEYLAMIEAPTPSDDGFCEDAKGPMPDISQSTTKSRKLDGCTSPQGPRIPIQSQDLSTTERTTVVTHDQSKPSPSGSVLVLATSQSQRSPELKLHLSNGQFSPCRGSKRKTDDSVIQASEAPRKRRHIGIRKPLQQMERTQYRQIMTGEASAIR